MPRYHESNDLDLVPIDTGASQPAKTPAPAPWPMPTFQPLEINNPLTHGQGKLPEDVRPDDPYAIFSLFFDENMLQILVTGFPIRMKSPKKACIACLYAGRICQNSSTRKPVAELSTNSIRVQKRRERAPRTTCGCGLCGIYLCNKMRCWKEHVEAISSQ